MGSDFQKFDYLIKILLTGNSGVGKSSLISRYCDGKFPRKAILTKGIKVKTKNIVKNDKRVNLQIWVFLCASIIQLETKLFNSKLYFSDDYFDHHLNQYS